MIHNVELYPGRGGQLVRSAGCGAQLMAKEGALRHRAPAQRRDAPGAIGLHGDDRPGRQYRSCQHQLGKAGRKRWLGWRPTVRGVAMDPNSHPHGGGEGRTPVGMPGPKTPWGKPALGYKTRRNKVTDKYIVRRRSESAKAWVTSPRGAR